MFMSFASAGTTIIFNEHPDELYSSGDSFSIPLTLTTTSDINEFLDIHLICEGQEKVFPQGIIQLSSGEEKRIEPLIILTKKYVGNMEGECKLKASLGETFVLSNKFLVSDLVITELKSYETEILPEQITLVEGTAIKENGEAVKGFVELNIISEEFDQGEIKFVETINNGFFSISFSLPKETRAGKYLVKLNMYETDSEEEITNEGFINYNLQISQVPTSLEIVLENTKVKPGTDLNVRTVLHDQTGEPIESTSIITIKNSHDEILEQIEKPTTESLEYPIAYNEPPADFTIYAVSGKLTNELEYSVVENQEVNVELKNKTLEVTNIGNVPYNKTLLVKIGEDSMNIDVSLDMDEFKKFILSAPDGEYDVEVIDEGINKISGNVILTGNSVKIKESTETLIKYPFVWIFIIAILGFVAFMFFKKGYKKSFFGKITPKKFLRKKEKPSIHEDKLLSSIKNKNQAVLSLSLKGDKQNASVICVKIKNSKDIGDTGIIQKIVELAEDKKAYTYLNQEYLFFILAPTITKTFKNEKVILEISNQIRKVLDNHNKLAKQKIGFGISLNHGIVVAQKDKDVLKFMSLGDLITTAKKVATNSQGEVLISEKMNDKLRVAGGIQTEKKTIKGLAVYILTKVRDIEKENEKFLTGFINRLEKEKKKR